MVLSLRNSSRYVQVGSIISFYCNCSLHSQANLGQENVHLSNSFCCCCCCCEAVGGLQRVMDLYEEKERGGGWTEVKYCRVILAGEWNVRCWTSQREFIICCNTSASWNSSSCFILASLPQFIWEFRWADISISIITVTGGRPKCCLIPQQTPLQLHWQKYHRRATGVCQQCSQTDLHSFNEKKIYNDNNWSALK